MPKKVEEAQTLLCPTNEMGCPYWQWGGICKLETAKDDCDAWYGIEDEEEDDESEEEYNGTGHELDADADDDR